MTIRRRPTNPEYRNPYDCSRRLVRPSPDPWAEDRPYRDRDGIPLSAHNLQHLQRTNDRRVRPEVAVTDLPNGWTVSTVFLRGFAYPSDTGSGQVYIFETAIWDREPVEREITVVERYATEDAAIAGHARWVARTSSSGLTSGVGPLPTTPDVRPLVIGDDDDDEGRPDQ